MAKFPSKPRVGDRTLQAFYKSICQIIDYLPSLTIKGNLGGIGVTHTAGGTIISNNSKQVYPDIYHEKPTKFYGDGLYFTTITLDEGGVTYDLKSNIDIHPIQLSVKPGENWERIIDGSTDTTYFVGDGLLMWKKVRNPHDDEDGRVNIRATNKYADWCIGLHIKSDNKYISGWYGTSTDPSQISGYGRYNIAFIPSSIQNLFPQYLSAAVGFPDYHKLSTSVAPGDGQGISFLYPTIHDREYCVTTNTSANVQARWAPVVGVNQAGHDVQVGTLYQNAEVMSSNVNGYLKVTVFDNGAHSGGCVRLTEDPANTEWSKSYPIYKFSSFSGSSGSGVIPYTSLTPNMLTVNNSNYTLSAASYTSLTPNLLSIDNTNHTISAASSGSAGGGMPWPNYANLDNSTGNVIMNYARYQAGAGGGWLRISYKGQMTDDCYYVKIGPDGNSDPTIGLWRVQTGYGYYGQIGNTWLLPVPPNNYIYVSFPNSVATAWFDSSLSPDSPQPVPPAAHGYPDDINRNFNTVYDLKNQAEGYYQECITKTNYDDANEYAEYAESCASDANYYATDSETKNAVLVQYGINDYTTKVNNTRSNAYLAEGYAGQARQYAEGLRDT